MSLLVYTNVDPGLPVQTVARIPCAWCGEYYRPGDRVWLWVNLMIIESTLTMHQRCFVDWYPRVAQDHEVIVAHKEMEGM